MCSFFRHKGSNTINLLPLFGKIFITLYAMLWRRKWPLTPVLLPGESHGRRSLVGCSPWGVEESDLTERLHFHFSLSYIGEGNGNPLQCSCLENPRDRGAWWAAVHWVTQSRTRLKRLSSSSKGLERHRESCWHLRRATFDVHGCSGILWGRALASIKFSHQ